MSRHLFLLVVRTITALALVSSVLVVAPAASSAQVPDTPLVVMSTDIDEESGVQSLAVMRPADMSVEKLVVAISLAEPDGPKTELPVNPAKVGIDVLLTQTELVFPAGDSIAVLQIEALPDTLFEGPEHIDVVATQGRAQRLRVTVVDDDIAAMSITTTLGVFDEGIGSVPIRVSAKAPPVNDVAFTVRAIEGSAVIGEDIAALESLVVLPAGSTEVVAAAIDVLDDDVAEPYEESFQIQLFLGIPGNPSTPLASRLVRVLDDDEYFGFDRPVDQLGAPRLTIAITEPTAGPLQIDVPISALYATYPYPGFLEGELFLVDLDPERDAGIADRGSDFSTATAGLDVTTTATTITITVLPDAVDEGTEVALLGLRHDMFWDGGWSQRVDDVLELVITDGDPEPDPFVFEASFVNGNTFPEASGTATMFLTRKSPAAAAEIRIVTVAGTADEGLDYKPLDQIVQLDDGATASTTVQVALGNDPLIDDLQLETFAIEVFHLDSGAPDAATVPVLSQEIVIEDDEPRYAFDPDVVTVAEPVVGNIVVEVPVRALSSVGWPLDNSQPITLRAEFVNPGAAALGAEFLVDSILLTPGQPIPPFLISVSADPAEGTDVLDLRLTRTPRFVGPQTEWIDDTGTLIITPAVPPSGSLGDDIRAAIAAVIEGFTSWTPQFDLSTAAASSRSLPSGNDFAPRAIVAPADLPVLSSDLLAMLELTPAIDLLTAAAFDEAADTIDALLTDLEANGCVVDFVADGVGGRPVASSGDVIQTTCSIEANTVDATGASPIKDDVSDLYQWLIDQPRTLGNLDVAGSIGASITVGVDVDGPYVAGSTGLRLQMAADGTLVTSAAGIVTAAASGTATADFDIGLSLDNDSTRRIRVADVGGVVDTGLAPRVDGEAHVTANMNNSVTELVGEFDAVVTTSPSGVIDLDTTTTFTGTVGFEVPRAEGDARLVEIEVVGVLDATGLQITGEYTDDSDLILDGFAITKAQISAKFTGTNTDAPLRGTFEVELNDGFEPVVISVDVTLLPGRLSGIASLSDDTGDFGVFQLDHPTYSLTFDTAPPAGQPVASVTVTANALFASIGEETVVDAEGVSGTILSTGTFTFTVDTGVLGAENSALRFDIAGLTFSSPDADGIVLRIDSIEVPVPLLGDTTTATVRDLVVSRELRIGASSITLDQGAFGEKPTMVAGLLPISIGSLELEFTERDAAGFITDLSTFVVRVEAFVADDAYADWPFDPVFQLGGVEIRPDSPPEDRQISFSAAVESIEPLVLTPIDFGPITVGVENLDGGAFVFDGSVTVDGYAAGVLQPGVEGLFTVTYEDGVYPQQELSLIGDFVVGADGQTGLDLQVGFGLDVDLRPVLAPEPGAEPDAEPVRGEGMIIEGLEFVFSLRFGSAASGNALNSAVDVEFLGVTAASLHAPFGSFLDISATDIEAFLDYETLTAGDESAVLLSVGGTIADDTSGATITAGDGLGPIAGWSGQVGNFAVTVGGDLVALDGFYVGLTIPEDGNVGLPEWVPLRIDDLAVEFGDLDLAGFVASLPDRKITPEVLGDIKVRVSGGLDGTALFPISAGFDDLVINIGKLVDFDPLAPFDAATFPIENLTGLSFGIEPAIDLGGLRISGTLAFAEADIDGESVIYARIAGHGESAVISGGVDVVVTQHGPVLLKLGVPLGIPLGQTGFVLTEATGAATFGDVRIDTPDLGQPQELLTNLAGNLPTDVSLDPATIASLIAPSVRSGVPTWNDGFAIAVAGRLINVAAGGLVEGDVVLAATFGPPVPGGIVPGFQLIGYGNVAVFGVQLTDDIEVGGDFARAGIMFDLSDIDNPRIDAAFALPAPGSPLGLLFPARATVAAQIDLTGVPAGVQAGLTALLDGAGPALSALIRQFVIDNPSSAFAAVLGPIDKAGPLERLRSLLQTAPETVVPALLALLDGSARQLAAFLTAIQRGARAALIAADSTFDPSFVFEGSIQPQLLGIPIGDPETEVEVTIDKNNISFTATGSLIELLKDEAGKYTLSGELAGGLFALATLNTTDRLTFGVQIPMPDITSILLDGGEIGLIDPEDDAQPQFAVTIEGDLTVAGMTVSLGGLFTAPDNATFVDTRVQRRFEAATDELVDPDRVQITRRADYENLIADGGLLLYGRLQMPRFIADPVGVVQDLPTFPSDALQILGWFGDVGTEVTATEEPASVTLFVPGLPQIFGLTPDQRVASINEWMGKISLTGVYDGTARSVGEPRTARLLSIPIGRGTLIATVEGLEVTAEVPLIGATATFIARVDEVPSPLGPVTIPVAGIDISISSTAAIATALDELGVPPIVEPADGATLRFRGYTPGFDLDSIDPLQQFGGVAASLHVDLPGIVDDAVGELAIRPSAGLGLLVPDFSARLTADRIGPFGGFRVDDPTITIDKAGGLVEIAASGSAIVPSWLANRTNETGITAAGCVSSAGALELRLTVDDIRLSTTPNVSITGAGASAIVGGEVCALPTSVAAGNSGAVIGFRRATNGVQTFIIDGSVNVDNVSGLPNKLLAVSGSLSTSGAGTLDVEFGGTGLNVGGLALRGSAALRLTGTGRFSLAFDAETSIPHVVTNAAVTGTLTETGAGTLSITVDSFTVPGLAFTGLALDVQNSGGVFRATLRGNVRLNVPGVPADTRSFSTGLAINGNFSFAIGGTLTLGGAQLNSNLAASYQNGSLTLGGTVSGRLQASGKTLGEATMSVLLVDGVFTASIPASNPVSVDLGFATAQVSGGLSSNGAFDFNGSLSTAGAVPFIVSWSGSVAVSFSNTGLSGTFEGNVTAGGISASATGLMSSVGRVSGTVRLDLDGDGDFGGAPGLFGATIPEQKSFAFDIGGFVPPDFVAPNFPAAADVVAATDAASVPVTFAIPVAVDNRDGNIFGVCSPASGSTFDTFTTTTVTCSATDTSGNASSVSFTVTVSEAPTMTFALPIDVSTPEEDVEVSSPAMPSGAVVGRVFFSDPIDRGEITVGADGFAYRGIVPSGLAPGTHHLVFFISNSGTGPSQIIVPLTIGADGKLVDINGQGLPTAPVPPVIQQPPATPDGILPTTGGQGWGMARMAWLLVAAGLLLVVVTRRRRGVRRSGALS